MVSGSFSNKYAWFVKANTVYKTLEIAFKPLYMIWWITFDLFFFQCHLYLEEEKSSDNLLGRITSTLFSNKKYFECLCELVKKQRRKSRKGTRGYTIPSGTAQIWKTSFFSEWLLQSVYFIKYEKKHWQTVPVTWNVITFSWKLNKSVFLFIVHGVVSVATFELVHSVWMMMHVLQMTLV